MATNQIIGTLTVLIVVICCYLAYRAAQKQETTKALFFIFCSGVALRVFTGMDFYLDMWDERYHALAARNMLEHIFTPTLYDQPSIDYDYREWTNNHIWIHKPPMTLWLMAASLKLFGINEIAVRIPSILLSSFGILLTFFIARHIFNEKTALLAAFFYAINGFLIELAAGNRPTDHVDTLFIFFIELGIMLSLYYTRNRSWLLLVLIGITTGIAVLTKWLPGLIVLPVLFVLLLQEKSWTSALYRCLIVLALAIIVFMPWQVYIYSVYPQEAAWENYFNGYRHIFEPLEGHEGAIWYQILEMPRVFGELIYIPLALFFFGLYKEKFKSMHFALAIWLILPYFFFSLVATKMPGYVMISAPAVFIILSYTFWDLYQRLSEFRYKKVAIFLLALLIILPIRYTFERVRPFRDIDRNPVWAQELRTLQTKVGNTKAAVFNVEHNIEAMFYAKVSAYPFIPNLQQVAQAQSRGFRIFIYDSPDIPFDISNNKDIVILHTMK